MQNKLTKLLEQENEKQNEVKDISCSCYLVSSFSELALSKLLSSTRSWPQWFPSDERKDQTLFSKYARTASLR